MRSTVAETSSSSARSTVRRRGESASPIPAIGTGSWLSRCPDGALATSGTAERGRHIINPLTGLPADHFASVTITASTLIEADVLATAAFARGADAVSWVERLPGVEGLFATPDGGFRTTSGFPLG